jgi:osmotically-inducible protein OsmY
MRTLRILAVCLLAAVGALAGCASSPGQRATGQVVDDGSITARVKTAIARDTSIGNAMNVNVTTYRGVVQLSGFVESEEQARRAAQVAQSVNGVQTVQNDLRVNPPQQQR